MLAALCWLGITIGVAPIVIECFDAVVTHRPDWLWFGAGGLLIALCRRLASARSACPDVMHGTDESA
jgi:hypothetical protein